MYCLFCHINKASQILFLPVQPHICGTKGVRIPVLYVPEGIFSHQMQGASFYKLLVKPGQILGNRHIDASHHVIDRGDGTHINRRISMDRQLIKKVSHRLFLVFAASFHTIAKAVLNGNLRFDCRFIFPVIIININIRHGVSVDSYYPDTLVFRI